MDIKDLIGNNFVPTAKYNAEKANTQAQISALNDLKSEYDAFKQSKMTDDERQNRKMYESVSSMKEFAKWYTSYKNANN